MIRRPRRTIWYPTRPDLSNGYFCHLFACGAWLRAGMVPGYKNFTKSSVIYGATFGVPNPKLMMTLKQPAPPPNPF